MCHTLTIEQNSLFNYVTSVGSVKVVTESSGSYVESIGSSTLILELAPEGSSSSSSGPKRDLLFGLFIGVEDSSSIDGSTPISGYNIVVCVPVT